MIACAGAVERCFERRTRLQHILLPLWFLPSLSFVIHIELLKMLLLLPLLPPQCVTRYPLRISHINR